MAVTTPGLFQPDCLTVTISQVPGVSLTLETDKIEAWSMPRVLQLPHFLLCAFLGAPSNRPPQQSSIALLPRRLQMKGHQTETVLQSFPVSRHCTYALRYNPSPEAETCRKQRTENPVLKAKETVS